MNGTKILGIATTHYGVDFSKYPTKEFAKHVVNEFATRMADNTQMLRWAKYPQEIHGEIPKLYDSFEKFAGKKKVIFVGLGGSKNPPTAAADLMGLDLHDQKKMTVAFLKPTDFEDVVNQINNVEDTVLVLSSKSGKTPEIIVMAKALRNHFVNHYISKGKSSVEAAALANKQIMVVSDVDPKKSVLRAFAQENGLYDAREGLFNVPDGMGGRFSTSAGYMVATIKAAGGSLKQALGFNKGAIDAIEHGLSTDFEKNVPLQNALFWTDTNIQHSNKIKALFNKVVAKPQELSLDDFSKMNLGKTEVNLYHGNIWERGKTFDEQLHSESIKTIANAFKVIPDSSHYAAESWYHPGNNNAFSLVTSADIGSGDLKYASKHYISDSIMPDVKNFGPLVHTHISDVTPKGHLKPEATGAYMTNKEFETFDRGLLDDVVNGRAHIEGAQKTTTQDAVESVKVSNQMIIEDYSKKIKDPKNLLD